MKILSDTFGRKFPYIRLSIQMYVITVVPIVCHKDIKRHLETREVLCLQKKYLD